MGNSELKPPEDSVNVHVNMIDSMTPGTSSETGVSTFETNLCPPREVIYKKINDEDELFQVPVLVEG